METGNFATESLDDLAFEGRNKEYGSYQLRKKYRKFLSVAFFTGTFLLMIVVAVPLVGAYMYRNRLVREKEKAVSVELKEIRQEEAPPPPPPPPPPEALVEKVKFTAPVVVEDTTIETGLATQDDLAGKLNTEVPVEDTQIEIKEEKTEVIETKTESKIFTVVEEQPMFPGGEEALVKFLRDNVKYPAEAKELNISGMVYVQFVVEPDGSITNISVLRGIGGGCDEEGVRIVKSMPTWVPGKQRGQPVRVQFILPVRFTLKG